MKTELTLVEARELLAPFDLRPRRLAPFEKGTVNSNFRVDTDGGRVFLRVNEGKREADVRFEAALLWHLGARRFPTPPPLRTGAGEPFVALARPGGPRYVTVFPWWPGAEVEESAVTRAHAAAVGEALGRLHLGAADFVGWGSRAGIYTFERIVERVEGFRERARTLPELAEVMPILDEEIAFLRPHRASPPLTNGRRGPALPTGTIHGDLFADNVLWTGERISAVLDFEQASTGRLAYDLAVALLAWCWDGAALDEARAWAMVAGYQRVRPLDEEERDGLWVEARAAAFRFTVTRITDVLLPSLPPLSQPARPGKDFRDYLARLLHLRAAGAGCMAPLVDERPPLRAV